LGFNFCPSYLLRCYKRRGMATAIKAKNGVAIFSFSITAI